MNVYTYYCKDEAVGCLVEYDDDTRHLLVNGLSQPFAVKDLPAADLFMCTAFPSINRECVTGFSDYTGDGFVVCDCEVQQ